MVNFDDIILESGQVSFDDMERAQNVAAQTDSSLLNVLQQLGLINEETLSRLIADHLDLPIAEAADFPEELLGLDDMNAQWMYRHSVLPLNKVDDVLDVAMLNPSDTELMKAINTYDEYGIPAATNSGRFQYSLPEACAGHMTKYT